MKADFELTTQKKNLESGRHIGTYNTEQLYVTVNYDDLIWFTINHIFREVYLIIDIHQNKNNEDIVREAKRPEMTRHKRHQYQYEVIRWIQKVLHKRVSVLGIW